MKIEFVRSLLAPVRENRLQGEKIIAVFPTSPLRRVDPIAPRKTRYWLLLLPAAAAVAAVITLPCLFAVLMVIAVVVVCCSKQQTNRISSSEL